MTKQHALEEMKKPICDTIEIEKDKQYVLKKLALTEKEFDSIMNEPSKTHLDYPNNRRLNEILKKINIIKNWNDGNEENISTYFSGIN